jgi:hypothetical protein
MAFIFVAKTNGEVLDAVARSQEEHKDIFIQLLISDDGKQNVLQWTVRSEQRHEARQGRSFVYIPTDGDGTPIRGESGEFPDEDEPPLQILSIKVWATDKEPTDPSTFVSPPQRGSSRTQQDLRIDMVEDIRIGPTSLGEHGRWSGVAPGEPRNSRSSSVVSFASAPLGRFPSLGFPVAERHLRTRSCGQH